MPTLNEVHQNSILEIISVAYFQEPDTFVAKSIFPRIPVKKNSDKYYKFNSGDLLRDDGAPRATLAESAGTDFRMTTDNYQAFPQANHIDIPYKTKKNADGDILSDRVLARILSQKSAIRFERYFAGKYFTTGLWTGSTTGTDLVAAKKWDKGGSNPRADVRAQKRSVQLKIGKKPNVMVVVPAVNDALEENAELKSLLGSSERAILTPDIFAQIFGVDKYIVGEASFNSGIKGATDSMEFIYGTDGVLLAYAAPEAIKEAPSAGYIFTPNEDNTVNDWGLTYEKIDMPLIKGMRHEQEFNIDAKLVCPLAAAFWSGVLTP